MEPIASDAIDGLFPYLASLDWQEPGLYYLLALHLGLLLLVIITRRWTLVQALLFFALLLAVYQAEDLNAYLAQNHGAFTRHQYFDSPGLFISTVMSMPFLLMAAIIVANWFYVSTQLMREMQIRKSRPATATLRPKLD